MAIGEQLPLGFETRSLQGREDFIVTPVTKAAVSMIDSWPDWPASTNAIFGPPGSGKSHLAAIWQERSAAPGIDFNTLDDVTEYLQSGSAKHNKNFVLRVPEPVATSGAAEESFFHLLNAVRAEQGNLLLISRVSPARLPFKLPDLVSRLKSVPAIEIPAPDDDLLRGIVTKLFNDRQLTVSIEVVDYIVPRMERSFEGARCLVNQLDRLALSEKRAITIPLVRRILEATGD